MCCSLVPSTSTVIVSRPSVSQVAGAPAVDLCPGQTYVCLFPLLCLFVGGIGLFAANGDIQYPGCMLWPKHTKPGALGCTELLLCDGLLVTSNNKAACHTECGTSRHASLRQLRAQQSKQLSQLQRTQLQPRLNPTSVRTKPQTPYQQQHSSTVLAPYTEVMLQLAVQQRCC